MIIFDRKGVVVVQPVNEGPPPSKMELLVELVADLGTQYDAIRTVLQEIGTVLEQMNERLGAIESRIDHFDGF